MVSMVFDDVVFDLGTLRTSLRARFDIYVRHAPSPWHSFAFLAVKSPPNEVLGSTGISGRGWIRSNPEADGSGPNVPCATGLDQYLGASKT
jgi:hypothetical protein